MVSNKLPFQWQLSANQLASPYLNKQNPVNILKQMSGPRMFSTRAPRAIVSQGDLELLHTLKTSLRPSWQGAREGRSFFLLIVVSYGSVAPECLLNTVSSASLPCCIELRHQFLGAGLGVSSPTCHPYPSAQPQAHMKLYGWGSFPGKSTDINCFMQVPAS